MKRRKGDYAVKAPSVHYGRKKADAEAAKKSYPHTAYLQRCLDEYKDGFDNQAKVFIAMMCGPFASMDLIKFEGGGIHCVGMSDTLRELYLLLIKIAAYSEALRVAGGEWR